MKQFDLEEYLKNPNKKIVTRDGRNVKIHCTNCVGAHPVIAEIEGEKYSYFYNKNGEYYFRPSISDLFFAPERKEGWINIYPGPITGVIVYKTEEDAKHGTNADAKVIATVKIEWEE